jgi:hypothetical protein
MSLLGGKRCITLHSWRLHLACTDHFRLACICSPAYGPLTTTLHRNDFWGTRVQLSYSLPIVFKLGQWSRLPSRQLGLRCRSSASCGVNKVARQVRAMALQHQCLCCCHTILESLSVLPRNKVKVPDTKCNNSCPECTPHIETLQHGARAHTHHGRRFPRHSSQHKSVS